MRSAPVMNPPEEDDVYYTYNGRPVYDLTTIPEDAIIHKHYRLRGGKGGFGSMLRAIGSQIEKTTNHEMCRDLSGRRMRDVNTERKLRDWYAKASDREREKLERYHARRQRRQELLAKGPLPDHKFSDSKYERQKRKISYELHGALDVAIASILNEKHASTSFEPPKPKKTRLWIEKLDGDFSSSSSFSSGVSSDDEGNTAYATNRSEEAVIPEPTDASQTPSSSGHASDDALVLSVEISKDDSQVARTFSDEQNSETPTPKSTSQPLTDEQLSAAPTAQSLEKFGLDVLKETLITKGLKCGGTLSERAVRLFSVRHLAPDDYPIKLRAKSKPSKK